MRQVELDRSIIEVFTFEAAVRRMLVAGPKIPAPAADRERALGKRGAEAVGAPSVSAQRRVKRVGEAARRRPERVSRQLRHDRLVEQKRCELLIFPRYEMGRVRNERRTRRRSSKYDLVLNQSYQDLRQRNFLSGGQLRVQT